MAFDPSHRPPGAVSAKPGLLGPDLTARPVKSPQTRANGPVRNSRGGPEIPANTRRMPRGREPAARQTGPVAGFCGIYQPDAPRERSAAVRQRWQMPTPKPRPTRGHEWRLCTPGTRAMLQGAGTWLAG